MILIMISGISQFFANIFQDKIWLATILISIVPMIELKGAIPFATNKKIWKNLALTNWQALPYALIGSCMIAPILAIIYKPIIKWLKTTKAFKKIAVIVENTIRNKAEQLVESNTCKKNSDNWRKKFFAIIIFVLIPLPLTGVWTGTCVAVFLDLDYLSSCISVILGNIGAGLIITLILEFLPALNDYLFFIFLALILIILLYETIKTLNKKNKVSK